MSVRAAISRILSVFRQRRRDADLDDEIRAHLDLLTADYERRGMTSNEARYAARRAFGGVQQMKETYRDRSGLRWLNDASQDVRYALRGLTRSPGFAAIAIVTLMLGIGANTAIFSLLDAVVLRSLPVQRPEELVIASYTVDGREQYPVAAYQFHALRSHREVLADVAAFRPLPLSVSSRGESEIVIGQLVSGNYHSVLGVRAVAGRALTPVDDSVQGNGNQVVISYGYWQRRFGGLPTAIGESLEIAGRPFTIVGVTGREFFGTEPGRAVDVTIPLSTQPQVMSGRPLISEASDARWLYVVGRLAPGVSRDQASAASSLAWDQLLAARTPPGRPVPKWPFQLLDGRQGLNALREQFSTPLRILMAMVGVVLLIACANLATLHLARSATRRHEVALRLAIGASRGRLVRQLLTESFVLSAIGGLLGVGLAYVAGDLLVRIMSSSSRNIVLDLSPNGRTLSFTVLVSVAAGLAFGVVPALVAARRGIATASRVPATAAPVGGWNRTAIAIQVALSLVLLVEAGLFARSLSALRGIDAGFANGDSVLLAYVRPIDGRPEVASIVNLAVQLSDRPDTIDARSVTFAMDTPLGGISMSKGITVPGGPPRDVNETVSFNFVGPRFFDTMGIAVEGRDIRPEDNEGAPAVAVVSQSMAKKYFPGMSALGRRIRDERVEYEVVGVAADVKYNGLREGATEMVYLPYLQGRSADGVGAIAVIARTSGDDQRTSAALRREVRAQSQGLVIALVQTLEERMDATLVRERAVATLSTWFAALALLLGCVGLYGTLAYAVVTRTVEFGIRTALGADTKRLIRVVVGESLRPVIAGVLLGLPLALAGGTLSESLLFSVTGFDPASYLFAILALVLAAVSAAWLPARRAAVVDPVVALRAD